MTGQPFDLNQPKFPEPNEEDRYLQFFENDPNWYHGWTLMAQSFRDNGVKALTELCAAAHFRAFYGRAVIKTASISARTLKFKNENYSPMKIDVIAYDFESCGNYMDTILMDDRFYITEGVRSDCVYYLKPVDKKNATEFYLHRHICGLTIQ